LVASAATSLVQGYITYNFYAVGNDWADASTTVAMPNSNTSSYAKTTTSIKNYSSNRVDTKTYSRSDTGGAAIEGWYSVHNSEYWNSMKFVSNHSGISDSRTNSGYSTGYVTITKTP
jgi:hypothetical protein